MSKQDLEVDAFSKFIGAVDPWLGEVVLIGGWAHRLYRFHPLARKLKYPPLTTLDGDVAVPSETQGARIDRSTASAGRRFQGRVCGRGSATSSALPLWKGRRVL